MTAVKVVDASALGALLFGEPDADLVSARLSGATLVGPTLLEYEIASICVKKTLNNAERGAVFLDALAIMGEMGIEFVAVDQFGVVPLAVQYRLSSYDASYLWLTQHLDAELVTLDRRLERAAEKVRQAARKPPST